MQGKRLLEGSDPNVDVTVFVGDYQVNITIVQSDGIWIDLPETIDDLRSIAASGMNASDYNCLSDDGELDPSTNFSTIYLIEVSLSTESCRNVFVIVIRDSCMRREMSPQIADSAIAFRAVDQTCSIVLEFRK